MGASLRYALIPNERKRLDKFKKKYPNGAFDLGQECNEEGKNVSKELVTRNISTDALHTLIMNAGILWVSFLGRWMVPVEMWLSQGFPVTKEAVEAYYGVVCQF